MTYAPQTLLTLQTYWTEHGGVALGIVGDTRHMAKGRSYHLGSDDLAEGAYSKQTKRDRAGLSEAASAIDLGKLQGKLARLQRFSVQLVEQARRNAPGTDDMREIIYSPDGKVVMRWDRERGFPSAPQPGEADSSHLTHTHISYYRDSEERAKLAPFRAYFEAPATDHLVRVAKGATVRVYRTAVQNGVPVITSSKRVPWKKGPSKAAAGERVYMETSNHKSGAYTAFVPKGAFAGQHIQVQGPDEKSVNGVSWS